jgi:hypothetical protein
VLLSLLSKRECLSHALLPTKNWTSWGSPNKRRVLFSSRNAPGSEIAFAHPICIGSVGEFRPVGEYRQAPAYDAPSKPLLLFDGTAGSMCLAMVEEVQLRQASGERVGVLAEDEDGRVVQRRQSSDCSAIHTCQNL